MSLLFLLFFGVFSIVIAFLLINFFIVGAVLLLIFGVCATVAFNPIYSLSIVCIVGSIIGIKYINKQLKKEEREGKLKMLRQGKICCKAIILFTVSVLLSYVVYSSVKYVKYSKMKKYNQVNKINVNDFFNGFQVFGNNQDPENDFIFDFQPIDIKISPAKQEKFDGVFSSYVLANGKNYEYIMNNMHEKLKFSNEYGKIKIKKDKNGLKIKGQCKNGKKIEKYNKESKRKSKVLGQNKLLSIAEDAILNTCGDVKNKKEHKENKKITDNKRGNEVIKKKGNKEKCCSKNSSKEAEKSTKKK